MYFSLPLSNDSHCFLSATKSLKDAISSNTRIRREAHSLLVSGVGTHLYTLIRIYIQQCTKYQIKKKAKKVFTELFSLFLLLFESTHIFVASSASPYYFRLFYLILQCQKHIYTEKRRKWAAWTDAHSEKAKKKREQKRKK